MKKGDRLLFGDSSPIKGWFDSSSPYQQSLRSRVFRGHKKEIYCDFSESIKRDLSRLFRLHKKGDLS